VESTTCEQVVPPLEELLLADEELEAVEDEELEALVDEELEALVDEELEALELEEADELDDDELDELELEEEDEEPDELPVLLQRPAVQVRLSLQVSLA
jgi:hypothetical protein